MKAALTMVVCLLVACGDDSGADSPDSIEQIDESQGSAGGDPAPPIGADPGTIFQLPDGGTVVVLLDGATAPIELDAGSDLVELDAGDGLVEFDAGDAGGDVESDASVDAGPMEVDAGADAGPVDFWGRSCAGLTCPTFDCPIGDRCCDVEAGVCACSRTESICLP